VRIACREVFPVKTLLSILTLLASCGAAASATAQVTFSPAAGTYSSSQSVSISCNPSSTTTIWYTTDGYPANTAATQYTGPIPVTGTTTINAICATTAEVSGEPGYDAEVNAQNSSNWKCNAPGASDKNPIYTQNGDFECESSGGVSGTLSSFNFTVNPGSPAYMVASTQASQETNSLLFIYPNNPATTCDNCTTITEHLMVQPTVGPPTIIRDEMDMEQCCDTSSTEALHQASLQCEDGANIDGYTNVWDINASGGWQRTTIPCDLSTSSTTDVVYEAQWVNGDTSCGGLGCMYLDALTVNGVRYWPLAQYCYTGNNLPTQDPNCAQEEMVSQDWQHWGAGNQHQIGLNGTNSTNGCDQPTCTGGRDIYLDNVTSAQSTVGTGSATYTIEGSTTPTPVITLPTGTYTMPQSPGTTITDAISTANISYCYTPTGTCSPSMPYSGSIYIDPQESPYTETICANATATGYNASSTACNYYATASGPTAQPSISKASGTYQMPIYTTISDSDSGAAILWCYTGSGTCTPTTMYTGEIYIDPASTETICATAWGAGEGQSTAECNTYTNEQ
jgi:Chitobiase/beta-hexosaminidase C-terminal domain